MKRRILSICLVLAMCLTMLPATAFAAGGGWTYDETAGTLTQENIVLTVTADAETERNLTVTGYQAIGSGALDLTGDITDSSGGAYTLTAISSNALKGCSVLTSITLPDSVTSIGGNAFQDCSSLASITLPQGLTSINDYTFNGCASLGSIKLPDSVTSIGFCAFQGCSRLTSIEIPDSVRIINDYAFDGCASLDSIELPDSLQGLGFNAFRSCASLTSIEIPSGVLTIGDGTFVGCSSLSTVTLPKGLTKIGDEAFQGCTSLTSIEIPDGVTSIGDSGFFNCTGLTSITIPAGVTSIGQGTFNGCTSLTSVTIPDGVTSIGGNAFQNCSSLASITLPQGLTSIGNSAFNGCTSLTQLKLPESLTQIGEYVISNTKITELTVPAAVSTISDTAFNDAGSLSSLTMLSDKPVSNLSNVLNRVSGSLKVVLVPEDSVGAYKNAAGNYASLIRPNSDGGILAQPTEISFDTLSAGYTEAASREISVYNYYDTDVTLSIRLEGENPNAFVLSNSTLAVPAGESAAFTVSPAGGLSLGNYTATVMISVNGQTETVALSLTVGYPDDARTIIAGGVELKGASAVSAYATTDANGAVTAQPNFTDSDNWNIKWDGSTLTLQNANITGNGNGCGIIVNGGCTIVLIGNNSVSAGSGYTTGYGIFSKQTISSGIFINNENNHGNCTIRAEDGGSLTAAGGNIAWENDMVAPISAGILQSTGMLTIESGTVKATGGDVTGGSNTHSNGIGIRDGINIAGGSVTATAGNAVKSYGLYIYSSDTPATVSGGELILEGDLQEVEVPYTDRNSACNWGITVAPAAGKMISVYTGNDSESATEIEGSPFHSTGTVDMSTVKYAHFTAAASDSPAFVGSYSIPDGVVGETYTIETSLEAAGGTAPYTFSVETQPTTGTLSINKDGCLVYTYPSNPAEATTATIKVTDSNGKTGTATVTIGKTVTEMYTLTVVNGTGSGRYAAGTEITITADSINYDFKAWTTDPEISLVDSRNSSTTLTMPERDLTVTANYRVPVTITYHGAQEQQCWTETLSVYTGDTYIIPGVMFPIPVGMSSFLGWKDESGNFYMERSELDIPLNGTETVKYDFYAVFGVNITVGGVSLIGSPDRPVYATTSDGVVTAQPAYTDSDNWNIKWDGSTLTLNGAVIESSEAAGIGRGPLSVKLIGENSVTGASYGIHATNLTLSGTGSLTASGATAGINVSSSLTIDGTTVTAAGSNGIQAGGAITVNGAANVTARSDSGGRAVAASSITVNGTVYSLADVATVFLIENGKVVELAAEPVTELYVNGENILTAEDYTLTFGEGSTAVYDENTNTLTLHDANITAGHSVDSAGSCGIYAEGDLNIVLEGNSTIRGGMDCGVYVTGDLSISGTGALTADGVYFGISVNGDLTVGGGNVTGKSTGDCGIDVNTDMTVNNGTVTGTCPGGNGIFVGALMAVAGGTVTGSGEVGISTGELTMTGGTVTGDGSNAAIVANLADTAEEELISLPEGYLPYGYKLQTVTDKEYGTFTSIVSEDGSLGFDSWLTGAVTKITLTAAPDITANPGRQTVTAGDTATFTVTAEGDGLTYQWQQSADGTTWDDIEGATNATYTTAATTTAMNGYEYRCVVTNSAGGSAASAAASLTVTEESVTTYTVTVTASPVEGGTVSGGGTYAEGETVTLTATANEGYKFTGWEVTPKTVAIQDNTFTMPGEDVTVTAVFEKESTDPDPGTAPDKPGTGGSGGGGGGGSTTPTQTPSQQAVDEIEDTKDGDTVEITLRTGNTKLDKEVFETLAGRDVTLEVKLPGGITWTVNGQDIPENVDLTDIDMGVSMDTSTIPVNLVNAVTGEMGTVQMTLKHDGPFGFTMTLTAPVGAENAGLWANLYYYDEDAEQMVYQTSALVDEDGHAALPFDHASQYALVLDSKSHDLPFTDLAANAWYTDAVAYVYRHDLMAGYGENLFGPDDDLSRAQLCQIIYNMEGQPATSGSSVFTDVADGAWYADAVTWAASQGIVGGYGNGLFGPEDNITREQLAAILYRYAQAKGYDVSIGEDTNILSYTDALDVSEWAIPAMQWACGAGIMEGDAGYLAPQGEATRAQAAAMLMRFCENTAQ